MEESIIKVIMIVLIGTLIAGVFIFLICFLSLLFGCNKKEETFEYRFKESKVTCFVVTKDGKQLLDCVKD